MCWKCDNPDATDEDYFDLVRRLIDCNGYYVQGVEPSRWRPGFAYTVGLTPLRHPELLVTGMPHRLAGQFLGGIAHQLIDHGDDPYVAGDLHCWPDGRVVEVVDVAEPTVHLVMAREIYGADIRAVQLVYADDLRRWPWEAGYRGTQPVLGVRADTREGG